MDNPKIENTIKDVRFLSELEQAINSGKYLDYFWNEAIQDEDSQELFDTDIAKKAVIEVLKTIFNN